MISFALRCAKAHSFDGWFGGSADFEAQRDKGLLVCPLCGDGDITKALMRPNVSTSRVQEKVAQEVRAAVAGARAVLDNESASSPVTSISPRDTPAGDGDVLAGPVASLPTLKNAPAPVRAYVEAVRKLRREVEATSEDVGTRFAEEARKMHHGEVEARAIRGAASLKEAIALDEEGIDVFVLPSLPEDGH